MEEEIKIVPKLWGKEIWLVNNDLYCGKLLCVDKDACSSVHFHLKKLETFVCLQGQVELTLFDKTGNANSYLLLPLSSPHTILPGQAHRFYGMRDSVLLEVSTHHNEEDVVRLTESYAATKDSGGK